MIATLLSSVSYLIVPGEMIKNGPGLMWGLAHVPITFLIVGYFIIPRIMRHNITSGYQLLEQKLGMCVRQTASALFVFNVLVWMGVIIYTCGLAVVTMTGIPLYYVLAAAGIFAICYTVMGGIRAVMITDVIQFIILIGGAILGIAYITVRCGGLNWWPDWGSPQLAGLQWKEVKVFSLNPFDRITAVSAIMTTSVWWICTATSNQVMIQRYLCNRDARQARRSFLNCLLGGFGIVIVLWIVGIALLGFFLRFPGELADPAVPVIEQADELFPHFIGVVLPQGISGLLIAALFAAAMSSLDSGISSISTVLFIDFKKIFAKGCGNDEQKILKRAKLTGVVIGIIGTSFSYLLEYVPGGNLYEVKDRISGFFIAPLFVLFVLAFFIKFSTPAGAWAAIIVGFFSGVLFSYWQQIVGLFMDTENFSFILITPVAIVLSLAAGVVVSAFTKARQDVPREMSGANG